MNATASIYTDADTEILVELDYRDGQRATRWEPAYGPEVTGWTWRLEPDCDVALPAEAAAAIESFVHYHVENDPHGWVQDALDAARF